MSREILLLVDALAHEKNVDRDVVFLGQFQNGLAVAAGNGVNGLVLVQNAGKSDIGHARLLG